MKFYATTLALGFLFLFTSVSSTATAQDKNPFIGRWDMVIQQEGKELPSWLEITKSGRSTLVDMHIKIRAPTRLRLRAREWASRSNQTVETPDSGGTTQFQVQ